MIESRPCGDRDAATVLPYTHYDVQPPLDEKAWRTPPFGSPRWTAAGRPRGRGLQGPRAMAAAMQTAYGRPTVELGQGGSIPLCSVLSATYPRAEIILIGVEEPLTAIHAPNESVSPAEIADMALAEALFLQDYS